MTSAQRIALALAFERLEQRIATRPVALPHPVIKRKSHHVVTASRRGPYRLREKNSEE